MNQEEVEAKMMERIKVARKDLASWEVAWRDGYDMALQHIASKVGTLEYNRQGKFHRSEVFQEITRLREENKKLNEEEATRS